MSLFRVDLSQEGKQGNLDIYRGNSGISLQRSIYAMGPNKINRKLYDGETFTDSNYWKRFSYPNVPYEQAFIRVLVDDGIEYTDEEENVKPKVYTKICQPNSSYENNIIDIKGDTGAYAGFIQICNQSSNNIKVRINGSDDAVFDMSGLQTQIFNKGDLKIATLEFDNSENNDSATIQLITSIKITSQS